MWRRPIRTSYRLWAAFAVALFVAAGCVNWVPESKALAYWPTWAVFLSGEYGSTAADFALVLAMWGLLLAVPSVLLGWVGQAAVRAAWVGLRGTSGRPLPLQPPNA
jgi:hypothetical protein